MIRLNIIFMLKDGLNLQERFDIINESVVKSHRDKDNVSCTFIRILQIPRRKLFGETCQDQKAFEKHSAVAHFSSVVPNIVFQTVDRLKIDQFKLLGDLK